MKRQDKIKPMTRAQETADDKHWRAWMKKNAVCQTDAPYLSEEPPPVVKPKHLKYGDIILCHGNTPTVGMDTDNINIGIFTGLSSVGAVMLMRAGDWVNFQLGKKGRNKLRVSHTFAHLRGEKCPSFIFRRIGSMVSFRIPDQGEFWKKK